MRALSIGLLTLVLVMNMGAALGADWATEVVDYSNLDLNYPYEDPNAALSRPTTLILDQGFYPQTPGSIFHCSMVYPAYNVAPENDSRLVVTVLQGGYITVKFDSLVYDDPQNWDGKDFVVFGNAGFTGIGYVFPSTNMELYKIGSGDGGTWEDAAVSVSQDGENFYALSPGADNFAPTQMSAWDWVENTWSNDLDYTKPVPDGLVRTDFANLYVAGAVDLYKGSAGGTAYDISSLPLQIDAMGRKWIQYVKFACPSDALECAEIDAVTRVSHKIDASSIGAAKSLLDGSHVILNDVVVTAGTHEVGRCCYVQDSAYSGIKVLGRVIDSGKKITLYGDMTTVDDERVVIATAIDPAQTSALPDATPHPMAMSNRSIVNGLDTTGMLVKTWGKVEDVDEELQSFKVDDGSDVHLQCVAPRLKPSGSSNPTNTDWGVSADPDFVPPADQSVVTVTGIISIVSGEKVLLLRTADDVALIQVPI